MHLTLDTIDIWSIAEPSEEDFLAACTMILTEGDVIVFGSYEPVAEFTAALEKIRAVRHDHITELGTCFNLNRDAHPNGCAYEVRFSLETFKELIHVQLKIPQGEADPSFADHIVAYRPSCPRIPLFSFHDAFCGGSLSLSGHFEQRELQAFASTVRGALHRSPNPELQTETTG